MGDKSLSNQHIDVQRRRILKATAFSAALLTVNTSMAKASKPPIGRVVIIGGGYAGTTAAKYIRMWSLGNIETIVVEQSQQFVSCPLSNLVLGGSKSIHDLTFGYGLVTKNHGIKWVNDTVLTVDAEAKRVRMAQGEMAYDRLIIAPGIDVNYEKIPNLASAEAQHAIPHAWKAGWQTVNLRQQLEAMADGGVFVMTIPKAPYRCPPGPYERACQIASYFKTHKPRSKVIILDANPEITSKKSLFNQAFTQNYAGIVDYRPNNEIVSVDIPSKTVTTEFEQVKADVLNVIPPQRAGKVAQALGLNNVDKRWCEVDFLSYASVINANIHVIGDSVSAGLPKSAHMATSQARVCAAAIVAMMSGDQPDPLPVFANTCYSFIDDEQAIHVANVYRYDAIKKIMVSAEGGGVSAAPSVQEGQYAFAWANNIWSDVLT
jgi:NADPH-dependent 2,4-dienoyl-CoA reductase/sulfur reductase-like enzyme